MAIVLAGCGPLPRAPEALPPTFIPSVAPSPGATADLVGGFSALERDALRVRVRTCKIYATGSAFAIDETHAITNRHVAEGATDISLTGFDGTVYEGTAILLSRHADLALITIKGTFPNISTLADAEPELDTTLSVAGYPKGEELTVETGRFLDRVPDELKSNEELVYEMRVEAHPGNSGSAVVNPDGEVVGVLYASDDRHTSWAVSLPQLKDFLDHPEKAQKNRADCPAQG
jgi:S1-C subfamily serine protease